MQEIKDLIKENNLKILNYVGTDGIGRVIKDEINTLIKENKMVTSVGERYNIVKDLIS